MKIALICTATLVACSATFAQTSIAGKLAAGYRSGTYLTTPAGVRYDNLIGGATRNNNNAALGTTTDSAGFGIESAEITFTVSEDLGGGMGIKAKVSQQADQQRCGWDWWVPIRAVPM